MYKKIFQGIKTIIPKISETEIIALKSGGTSYDRHIFKGKIDLKDLYKDFPKKNNLKMDEKINALLKKVGPNPIYPSSNINEIMNYSGKNGFLSMIIDKKYGGNLMSIENQSQVLTKISSYNPSLGVSIMVPNSLGPAELLQHYGTESQKNYFLPKLSNGDFIPCFGLTGPNNGSDAIGEIDEGIVEKIDGKIKIKVQLNKRYITLAPVSNLLGVAFRLNDPNNFLKNNKSGITLALIENYDFKLNRTYHNPNNAGFPNGTIKGTIILDPEQVIGGPDKIGEGWKMLMECLAVGRGVSLPASSSGASKFVTQSILNYINIRKQFNIKLGNMEAVREKFINMYMNTWIIHTSIKFTNHILDKGQTPSVLTAIMKQQTTERSRFILNNGMDIYSGSGICIGNNNFFSNFYNSSPIGITVEGSNTLTRGLIIFGQGLNKSHPYIFPIFQSIQDNNLDDFKFNFNKLLVDFVKNYINIFNPFNSYDKNKSIKRLEKNTLKFSILTNFIAILGGKIKSKQMISGNMADILSNLYLGYSLVWYNYHFNDKSDLFLTEECINYLMDELEYKMNLVIENYSIKELKILLLPLKNKVEYSDLENKNKLYKTILEKQMLREIFKNDIYFENTVLEKMEKIIRLDEKSPEYKKLYQEIISVGEYPIDKII